MTESGAQGTAGRAGSHATPSTGPRSRDALGVETFELEIDGRSVRVAAGTSLYEAIAQAGTDVPALCHDPKLRPVGVCRICSVEVEGARTLVASCVRAAEPGMVVRTASDRVMRARRGLTELLMSEQPAASAREVATGDDALLALARNLGVERPGAPARTRPIDDSSAVIAVDHQACILCDRCIRACDEVQVNHVIGRAGKGAQTRIAFDLDVPMGESTCVSCGECAAACPTGALVDLAVTQALSPRESLEPVDSVCPYCGVGCAVRYHVDREANRIVFAEGRGEQGNRGRLCVKGRYGWDYAFHGHRLTKPLIRVDYPKRALSSEVAGGRRRRGKPGGVVDYDEVMPAFREASWEEALDLVASRLGAIRDTHGPRALAGFGSAKCSNEEAYVFQRLVRAAFGTNNVDHCTRLCHASSVAALLEMIGSGAVTTSYGDVVNAELALVTGSNASANHPVAATFFKQAAAAGTKLLVVDPRWTPLCDHAWRFCQIRSGTDVAFYNAMMHVIIEAGLVDVAYVEQHTRDFERVTENVRAATPERAAAICGVPAETIREVALEYGRAKGAITYWGMGMSQHVHGTDNCRCIISLALMTGNIGRSGSGLHPLRGQNNVQGASDAGLIPMVFPDYQSVTDPEARAKFEAAWGVELDPEPGLTVVEIMKAAGRGEVKGMYMLGENPFLSDPDTNAVRAALSKLDFLVAQDIFLTETAEFADVVLPATSQLEKHGTYTNTDRRVQLGRPAVAPPGEARLDWQIICDISRRLGHPMPFDSPSGIFDEMTALTVAYRGLSHELLGAEGKTYPCDDPEHEDGTEVMFGDGFPTADGRARFVPAVHQGADELPDDAYPFVLVTGRVLEHWHTGVMTRRSKALSAIEPDAFADLHDEDAARLGVAEGEWVRVASRRGEIHLAVRIGQRVQPGSIFVPFHYREAGANLLTNPRLDPDGKIPEFKFCAVRVEAAAPPAD